jgi:transposase
MRVGMEATGYSRWFERLLAELGIEVWIGDAAEIKTKRVRKQKTDREDARLLLRPMRENNFPRIWVPSPENRDVRQLRIADHTTPRRPKYFRFGLRNFLSREYELLMMKAVPFRCI